MATSKKADRYNEFIETFGTHFVMDLKMGSRFGYYSQFSENAYASLEGEGISVAAEISYEGPLFSAGASASYSSNT